MIHEHLPFAFLGVRAVIGRQQSANQELGNKKEIIAISVSLVTATQAPAVPSSLCTTTSISAGVFNGIDNEFHQFEKASEVITHGFQVSASAAATLHARPAKVGETSPF